MTPVLVPIIGRSRWNRACLKCGQAITLGRNATTNALQAFEADPVSLKTGHGDQGVIEHWDDADRHRCGGAMPQSRAR